MPNLTQELSSALIRVLSCPVCGQALHIADGGQSLVCAGDSTDRNPKGRAHCFDGAAAGYVPLAPRHSGGGDSKEAVRARNVFLSRGYYAPAAEAITEAVRAVTPVGGLVLDAGCGEGYYSNTVAAAGYPTLGVDLSKFAVEAAAKAARAERGRRADAGRLRETPTVGAGETSAVFAGAAREAGSTDGTLGDTSGTAAGAVLEAENEKTAELTHGGATVFDGCAPVAHTVKNAVLPEFATLYAVGSVFALPVADGAVDTVVNIFAPCVPAEYARVLKPGGHLIVAGAGERHLMGLKEAVYDDPYLNDPRRDLPTEDDPALALVDRRTCTFTVTVEGQDAIAALFSMTPYYWRTPRESHGRVAALQTLATEVAFDIHIYQKR